MVASTIDKKRNRHDKMSQSLYNFYEIFSAFSITSRKFILSFKIINFNLNGFKSHFPHNSYLPDAIF